MMIGSKPTMISLAGTSTGCPSGLYMARVRSGSRSDTVERHSSNTPDRIGHLIGRHSLQDAGTQWPDVAGTTEAIGHELQRFIGRTRVLVGIQQSAIAPARAIQRIPATPAMPLAHDRK